MKIHPLPILCALLFLQTMAVADVSDRARSSSTSEIREASKRTREREEYAFREPILYHESETSVDVFGNYVDTEGPTALTRLEDGFGSGLGVNHFWTRHWGAGFEGYWWFGDRRHNDNMIGSVSLNLIHRWPMKRFAPYIFAGVGGIFLTTDEDNQAIGHAGLGLEYRCWKNVGLFSDFRYVVTDFANNFVTGRLGFRFHF